MKRRKLIIIISTITIAIICIILCLYFNIILKRQDNNEIKNISELNKILFEDNVVIIKNNEIKNENLIDEFIENAIYSNIESQEINIIQDNTKIKVKYIPGEYAKDSDEKNITMSIGDGSFESNKKIYGYYSLIIDNEIKGEYPLNSYTIKRNISDNNVTLYFDTPLIEHTTIQEICKYSVETSNYNKKYTLLYKQRKDIGIKNIYDAGEYLVKTFGGDVDITIENDMVYKLEDALDKKIITPEDIINQAKMDLKYGICQKYYYNDGGSIEYSYFGELENQYTILKLNTLDNDKDLIIGMSGQIINLYNENK